MSVPRIPSRSRPLHVRFILPALKEATDPYWRPIKYSLFPPLGLATLAAYLSPDDSAEIVDEHVIPHARRRAVTGDGNEVRTAEGGADFSDPMAGRYITIPQERQGRAVPNRRPRNLRIDKTGHVSLFFSPK
jgi:hypothetical protein